MNQKLSRILRGLYFKLLQFMIPSQSSLNASLHAKKWLGKKEKKRWHYDKILVHLKEFSPPYCKASRLEILSTWCLLLDKIFWKDPTKMRLLICKIRPFPHSIN
jgi:hypothetical protein